MCITKHPSLPSESLSRKLTKKDETDNLINKLWNEPFTLLVESTLQMYFVPFLQNLPLNIKSYITYSVFKKTVPLFFIRLQLYKTLSCDL